jgi:hypothetical protein
MVSSMKLRISVVAGVRAGFVLPFVYAGMRRKRRSCATVLGRRPVEGLGHCQKRTVLT